MILIGFRIMASVYPCIAVHQRKHIPARCANDIAVGRGPVSGVVVVRGEIPRSVFLSLWRPASQFVGMGIVTRNSIELGAVIRRSC